MNQKITLTSIAKALANDEFIFYYQPIVSMLTGKICGAESLIRWRQPDGTIIPPDEFIPIAEETGFITEITRCNLPKVVKDINTLNQINDSIFVSFNVSAKDFADTDFLEALFQATTVKLENLANLCIEITETAFLPSDEHTQKVLHDIDAQGLSIILNDFSAGYTSFNTLTHLPLKAIKVAMDVTQRAAKSKNDFRLFRHLVSMAHQLQLNIIAEGVEDEETHILMAALGCTHVQGFYYDRPMPLADFIELLQKGPSWLEYPFGLEYLAQYDHIDFRRDVIRAALMISTHQDKDLRERSLMRLPELEPKKCLFGQWLENTRPLNLENKTYQLISDEHIEFHHLARTLLDMALEGENKDKITKAIVAFSDKSKQMMDLIQDLEIERLKESFF